MASADYVLVTLPHNAATEGFVGRDALAAMQPHGVILNVGRGPVIDETALLSALDDGRIAFAALDVFEQEPLPNASALWSHPSVLISPHTAALNSKEEERIARRFAENATRLLEGRDLRAQVDTVEFY